ncbi:MAG: chemotaxis protein, partial [Chloroflexi bacterium]
MFDESVSKKIHVPLVLSMFIGLLTILINFFYSVEDIRSEVYSSQSKELRAAYVNGLREKKVIALTNVINLSSNYSIIESLKSQDRNVAIAGLQTLSRKFKEQTIYKNIKVHLHDANLRSFLRTWDVEKYGEELAGFRKTLRDVKKNKKAIATIELGRAGLLVRGIAPIENDGVYLGSVEFMQGFNSIVKNLRKNREYETAFLMKEDYLSVATALSSSPKIKEFVLAVKEKNVDKDFLNSLKGVEIEDTKNFQISDEYFLVSEPIKDFSNVIVGYALIGEKTSMVETVIAKAKSSLLKQVYIIFFIDIIILIYLIIIVRKKIIRPIVDMEKMAQELSL